MPEASASSLTFYPAYCWPASPTYNTWCKLSCANVHALTQRPGYEGQRVYFHKNHPIRYVRLVGLVTSFDSATETTLLHGPRKLARTHKTPWTFTLDDGSGENVEVVCWRDDKEATLAKMPGETVKLGFADMHEKPGRSISGIEISLDDVELGKVVKVKGWIDEFRGRRQMLLERVHVLRDSMEEVKAWDELATFQIEVLSKPWMLTKEKVKGMRRREERNRRGVAKVERRKRDDADGKSDGKASDAPEKGHRIRVVPAKA